MTTTTTRSLYARLAAAQAAAHGVEKDGTNTFHRYTYATAESLIREAKVLLAAEGLAVFPHTSMVELYDGATRGAVTNKRGESGGGAAGELHFSWLLVCSGTEESLTLSGTWPIVPESGRPIDKAVAAARTASLGYMLRDLLQLPRVEKGTELDDDSRDEPPPRQAPPRTDDARRVAEIRRGIAQEFQRLGVPESDWKGALQRMNGGTTPANVVEFENCLEVLRDTEVQK